MSDTKIASRSTRIVPAPSARSGMRRVACTTDTGVPADASAGTLTDAFAPASLRGVPTDAGAIDDKRFDTASRSGAAKDRPLKGARPQSAPRTSSSSNPRGSETMTVPASGRGAAARQPSTSSRTFAVDAGSATHPERRSNTTASGPPADAPDGAGGLPEATAAASRAAMPKSPVIVMRMRTTSRSGRLTSDTTPTRRTNAADRGCLRARPSRCSCRTSRSGTPHRPGCGRRPPPTTCRPPRRSRTAR